MGSKLVGFRIDVDLADEIEAKAAEKGQSTSELLRGLVDDLLYPGSGRERIEARREVAKLDELEQLYGVKATQWIADQVNAQIKMQLQETLGDMVDERLELVQIDHGLVEAEKESLARMEKELADLKVGINKLAQVVKDNVEAYEGVSMIVNKNVDLCNESFNRVSRLFQVLEAHSHDGDGAVKVLDLLAAEVAHAEKRVGELPGDTIRSGKVKKKGWKYLEKLGLSVRE